MFPSGKNNNGSNLHKYSTDEHVVGTWIDGKPIYEKTYDLVITMPIETPIAGNWVEVADLASYNIDVDNPVWYTDKAYSVYVTPSATSPTHTANWISSQDFNSDKGLILNFQTSTSKLFVAWTGTRNIASNMEKVRLAFTLRYTKTTD